MGSSGLITNFTKRSKSQRYEDRAQRSSIPSISFDLDPAAKSHYATIQSRKFAIQAKAMSIKIRWTPFRKTAEGNTREYQNRKHISCFPFLAIFRIRQPHIPTEPSQVHTNAQEEVLWELIGESLIMKAHHVRAIGQELPPRAVGFPWTLRFCTSRDGYSLHNLYRKLGRIDAPVLVVVEDLGGRVFGGLSSTTIKASEHFFGTSECFLFSFCPEFEIYKWNGDNFYFVQACEEFLAFGSGLGQAGLWLDSDLNKGTTDRSLTYGNPPLVPESDFVIKNLECWTFG